MLPGGSWGRQGWPSLVLAILLDGLCVVSDGLIEPTLLHCRISQRLELIRYLRDRAGSGRTPGLSQDS